MKSSKFIKGLKRDIKNRLADYADNTYYACDLAYTLFEDENANGSVFCNKYKTTKFIKANFELFGKLVEYCKDNMDMELNPFSEPGMTHVILLIESSQYTLAKLPFINKKWNDKITLDKKTISTICKQLNKLDLTEDELFKINNQC